MSKGKAYIIGAGPGEFGLLTIRAKNIIEKADCLIYDRLIDDDILKLAKHSAELIYLGKKNTEGGHIQNEINKTLIEKCLEGKVVARVKGGDPFVFGRGGEEVEELIKNDIEYEVIPGVTSAISVPEYAGIPVTHRGVSRSFHVFTGHTMTKGKWHNFETIARLEGTLVFLMGIKNLNVIVEDLIKNGKNPSTPVAIIENGATPKQRVVRGTLENIVVVAEEEKINPPAITVVGDVVNLRDEFKWFEKIQDKSNRILITRDKKHSQEFAEKIQKNFGKYEKLPFIEIEELKINTENLSKYKAILFNSQNGVKVFFDNIRDLRILNGIKIGAVGSKTKEILEQYKIVPDFFPEEYLVDRLMEESVKYTEEGDNVLVVTSDISPCDENKYKKLYNRNFEKVVAYNTKKIIYDKAYVSEILKSIDIVTFLSSSTVEAFFESIEGDISILNGKEIASIGPVTTKTLKAKGLKVDYEAKQYTVDGLIDVIFK